MQTDWGVEYEKLHGFFQKVGITHHVSCPHAHQQNGSAERKHRHIVEVGLALLAHASMPLKFWDEAFLTATFLINLLPSKVINFDTPTERLLGATPNYESLRIFGCACWPNLRPYNKRKLSFRSVRCVFLGYSPHHKGVKCLDPSTGRVYISRDVVFDESVFPFAALNPNAGRRLQKDILLLPTNTSSHHGDANIDDYMPLPIVPNVFVPENVTPDAQDDAGHDTEKDTAENVSGNDEEEHCQVAENAKTGSRSHVDTAVDLADVDPGADSPASASESAPAQPSASCPRTPRAGAAQGVATGGSFSPLRTNPVSPRRSLSPGRHSRSASPTNRPRLQRHRSTSPTSGPRQRQRSLSPPSSSDHDVDGGSGEEHEEDSSSTPTPPPPPPVPRMTTRLQKGIKQPKKYTDGTIRYGMLTSTGEPSNLAEALDDIAGVKPCKKNIML
jgi:hypothetical protein